MLLSPLSLIFFRFRSGAFSPPRGAVGKVQRKGFVKPSAQHSAFNRTYYYSNLFHHKNGLEA